MEAAFAVTAVVLGLVLLLAVPLHVAFRFEGIEAFKGEVSIRWLFGLVRLRIRVPRVGKARSDLKGAQPTSERRVKSPKRDSHANIFAVLRQAAFRRRVYRLVRDLVAAAHLRGLHLRLRLGLGDPADTGRLWAVVGPLAAAARNQRDAEVEIEPEFVDPVFDFQTDGRMLLVPLQFLVLAIGFALSPSSVRAWRTMRGGDA